MRTIIVVRRYRCITEGLSQNGQESDRTDRRTSLLGGARRNSDSRDRRYSSSSRDRRGSDPRDRRNSDGCEKEVKPVRKEIVYEDGFMQICGASTEMEMKAIQDSLHPLEEAPYKLECTCSHCISYSYEETSTQRQFIEPFMRAINVAFSTLCKYGYTVQSTSSIQNADDSSTTTWVWVKSAPDQESSKNKEDANKKLIKK